MHPSCPCPCCLAFFVRDITGETTALKTHIRKLDGVGAVDNRPFTDWLYNTN